MHDKQGNTKEARQWEEVHSKATNTKHGKHNELTKSPAKH